MWQRLCRQYLLGEQRKWSYIEFLFYKDYEGTLSDRKKKIIKSNRKSLT